MNRLVVALTLALSLFQGSAEGKEGDIRGGEFLNVPLSVRQMGMGEVSAGGDDVLRGWSNPALLAGSPSRGRLAVNGGSMLGGTQSAMGAGGAWAVGDRWTVGALVSGHTVAFTEVNEFGDTMSSTLTRSQLAGGAVAAVGYGRLRLGLTLKGVSDAFAGDAATGGTADAGLAVTWGALEVCAAVNNLGPALRTVGDETETAPSQARVGVTGRLDAWHLLAAAEFVGGDWNRTAGAGLEWWPVASFAVRAGAAGLLASQALKPTAGLTATWRALGLDYALQSHPLGASHRVSLSWAFGERSVAAPEPVVTPEPIPVVQQVANVPPADGAKRMNIAVATFDPQGVSGSDAAVIGDMFRSELVKEGSFDVVEKANMDKILAEQAFQQSGCTTQECAVRLGKVLNVKYLVVGSFGKLMDKYILSFRMVEVESTKIIYSDDARGLSTQEDVTAAIIKMTRRMGKAVGRR